ncbi:hypothetical protein Tco_0090884 [Tanacetum coccineum]
MYFSLEAVICNTKIEIHTKQIAVVNQYNRLTFPYLNYKTIREVYKEGLIPRNINPIREEEERFFDRFGVANPSLFVMLHGDDSKEFLRACPHHGFSELHQLDTFYSALNSNDQDLLNSAAGGNVLDKMPRDCLAIIKSKSKVHYSQSKSIVSKVSMSSSTPGVSPDVAELKDMVRALLLDKKKPSQAPAIIKAVEESCVTCGGAHSYRNCLAIDGNI